eukprot:jgi/Ulvmu1/5079/UM021_0096.1
MGCSASIHPASVGASRQSALKWQTDTSLYKPAFFKARERMQCIFEGGAQCRREDPDEQHENPAIPGLHSSWITPDVLAMARPWQANLKAVAPHMKQVGITMVLNCQETGEHAGCGPGILRHTGFSYDPETLQQHNISYYHVAWPDMQVPALPHMLRIVQLMHTAVQSDGRKVAVHCHAGLGRTGLVIACYMVFSLGVLAAHAILEVRSHRKGALQTREQELFVVVFEKWVQHLRCRLPAAGAPANTNNPKLWDDEYRIHCAPAVMTQAHTFFARPPSTLTDLLDRQKLVMHGRMLQHYWNVPELLLNMLLVRVLCGSDCAVSASPGHAPEVCNGSSPLLRVPWHWPCSGCM